MLDKVVLCVHNDGKTVQAFVAPGSSTPEAVAAAVMSAAKHFGYNVQACVVPVKAGTPEELTGFIEACRDEISFTIPKQQAGPGTLFPRNAYD